MTENEIASIIINKAFLVRRSLGAGLLESAYQKCLYYELKQYGLNVRKEVRVSINYKGLIIDQGYRIDLLVNDLVVVELKAVDTLIDIHYAQVLTYLRLGNYKLGLLLNFNEVLFKKGIRRFVNKL